MARVIDGCGNLFHALLHKTLNIRVQSQQPFRVALSGKLKDGSHLCFFDLVRSVMLIRD